MTSSQITIAIVVVIALGFGVFTLINAKRKSAYESAKESLDIRPGPIRHSQMTDEQVERVRKLQEVFAEVYPVSHDEWLDGFLRDSAPENEIAIWEHMASAYSGFLELNQLNAAARKEAFGLILVRSSTSDMSSQLKNLEELSPDQANALIDLYEADPKPITYESAEQDAAGQPATPP